MIYVQYDGPLGRRRGSASEGQQSREEGSETQGDEGQLRAHESTLPDSLPSRPTGQSSGQLVFWAEDQRSSP